LVWIQLVVCLAIIVVTGSKLSRYADLIAEKTGLGRVWIGVVLLATITSLPELATGISSVTLIDRPDLTMGDLFGSNLINLVIIAIIDVVYTRGPVLHYLSSGIVLAAVLSIFLIAAAAVFLYLSQNLGTITLFGRIGVYSIILFGLYLIAQYMIFRFQSARGDENEDVKAIPTERHLTSLTRTISFFVIAAVAIVGAGIWLASIGNQITEVTGLEASFVGTLFLAICTSAPEMVVSISAVRLGALDMAVSNMVGSNLFNMGVIIFIDDLFYPVGPILQGADADHVVTALFALLMSSIIIIGVVFRPRFWLRIWIGMDSAALTILYIGAIVTLYFMSKPV